jgi:hypothetical protein
MKNAVAAVFALSLTLSVSFAARAEQTLYDNGSVNGNLDAFSIADGNIVGDTFVLTNNYTVNAVTFGDWNFPGESATNIDWSITSAPFGGDVYGSGSGANVTTLTDYGINNAGYDVTLDTFDIAPIDLISGTYYLNLQNAVTTFGDPAYWDENNGPSSAYSSSTGSLMNYDIAPSTGSESFQVLGTTNTSTTPEPASTVVLGLGALSTVFLCLKRRTVMARQSQ